LVIRDELTNRLATDKKNTRLKQVARERKGATNLSRRGGKKQRSLQLL